MNAIKSFFSKDNATAKLSGYLILAASIITLAGQYFKFPPTVFLILTLASGAITAVAAILKANPVITKSLIWLLIYTFIVYVSDSPLIVQISPNAQQLVGFLGAMVKLFTPFTTQEPGDSKPPTDSPLSK